ncbi:jg18699 [Pararge aegeria aegeria]|uniref:Jg18699 protein n=1 Tax=Pararge aegeria aegeria TaxID=348720 RepID=A0A8S4SAQ9_9NEOP|nr:jg18699 [Pararge aegeria aegeria]
MGFIRKLRVSQRAMESAMLGVSLCDKIRNEDIRFTDKLEAQRVAKLKGPKVLEQRLRNGKDYKCENVCWNGDPAQLNAALVGPHRGGQTTSNESLGAAGNKRPRTEDFVQKTYVHPSDAEQMTELNGAMARNRVGFPKNQVTAFLSTSVITLLLQFHLTEQKN